MEYFTELKVLWEELENYSHLHSCICPVKCSCLAAGSIREYRNQDYVMRFLTGLNEQYGAVKSQILLMEPLLSLNRASSMVLQQEKQFGNGEDAQFSANATDGRRFNSGYGRDNNGYGRGKSKRFCTFCGKTGHTVDYCYSKHGHPDDVKYKSKNTSANSVETPEYMEDDKYY